MTLLSAEYPEGTPLLTGPAFQQVPASDILVVPTGGVVQTLADALASGSQSGNVSSGTVIATGGITARSLAARAADVINVKDGWGGQAGAKGDGRYTGLHTHTLSLSTPTNLRIAGASFASTDVGKVIFVPGAGVAAATLITTIAAVTDATNIVLSTPASTALSGFANSLYGTDDSTAINAATAVLRASTTASLLLLFPYGLYITRTSLNFTNFLNQTVVGYGATIYAATNGTAAIDAMGFFNSQISGLFVQGDITQPPSTGLQTGRTNTTGQAFGLNRFTDMSLSGYYTLAPVYDMASETTVWDRVQGNNLQANAYGLIADGINHFGLTSYVTISWTANTPQTFTMSEFRSCRFVATASGSNGVWIAAPGGMQWSNGYIKSPGYGVVIYQTGSIRASRLQFINTNIEGPPTDNFYIDGTGTTAINGLHFTTPANIATNSMIKVNPLITAIKMRDADFRADVLNVAGKFFDDITPWANGFTGDISFSTTTAAPSLPVNYTGRLTLTDDSVSYYNFTSPQVPSNIPQSYGSGLSLAGGVLTASLPVNFSAGSISASGIVSGITLGVSAVYSAPNGGALMPIVTINGVNTSQATAIVTQLRINSIGSIVSGGTGYVTGDAVRIPVAAGGVGTQAIYTVTAVAGVVTAMAYSSGGLYTTLPADVSNLAWETVSGAGSGLTTHGVTFRILNSSAFTITAPGGGYTAATVAFSVPSGMTVASGTSTATAAISSLLSLQPTSGDVVVGQQAAIGTTSTAGFLTIPFCAGAPTGVPTNAALGIALIYDTTNHKLWAYDNGTSAWRGIVLT